MCLWWPSTGGLWFKFMKAAEVGGRVNNTGWLRKGRGRESDLGMEGWKELRGLRGIKWWWWWREGGLSLEPPLPETTSRPSHIQINTKPVGSREGRQIRRRQGREADWRMAPLLHWGLFRITGRAERSKAGSDRFIMSVDSALAFNTRLKTY